jgi:hypothetical protein
MKKLFSALAAAAGLLAATAAQSAVFGYYLSNTGGSPAAAITAAGHTPLQLNNLTAGDLAGIDVLWILNSNGGPDANVLNNIGAVTAFVQGGGVLSFHDRNIEQGGNSPTQYIPGAAGVVWTGDFGSDINVLANNTVTNGPGGVITDTTLDGGNFSFHGHAALASLPGGAVAVLSTGIADQIVDFYFPFGAGTVYFSAMPLDFYLAGAGNNPPGDEYRNIYAVNEAAFQAQLQAVPEPGSVLLISLGLGLLALRRRAA